MIYLDYNATALVHDSVKSVVIELLGQPINPSAIHSFGRIGENIMDDARQNIFSMLGLEQNSMDYEITFTSSGTESNNLIISNYLDGEVFISNIEHESIFLYKNVSPNVKVIAVDRHGMLDLDDLRLKLSNSFSKKILVSVMMANNEIGVIQDIKAISSIAHKFGAAFHSDMAQVPGKIAVELKDLDVDFISLSSHKFSGFLGSGALVSKKKYKLTPMMLGGGQEQNLRSGTENIVSIAAFGEASKLVLKNQKKWYNQMLMLRDRLEQKLSEISSSIRVISQNVLRLPNTSLIINPNTTSDAQVIFLDLNNIAVSAGSACKSRKKNSISHVLDAIGLSKEDISSAVRVSFGPNNTEDEVDQFINIYSNIKY
ncbi:cysteine desulfurase family protein [Rickettsia endosymbiont of Cardiosporidium cionae]|uniref:cysteine desulfurase family protein n=1 Tax=Rickettsia endosymbiont of Cardiosporidium cionae TaxID=2777155 RepID=UPI001893DA55|nr:cysteine desulfurase family protein [Rickettsia endosymbiont of Cardiosporidium cionae]KAF8818828.1 cysteine desulfurase [Rickettsia endosymbiont of Cardiosporidium cionae]